MERTLSGESGNLSLRTRISRAAWIGLGGGLLYGFGEAWTILGRHSDATGRNLIGIIAALGFVVALEGALGTLVMTLAGLVASQVKWIQRRFHDAASWSALCAAAFAGLVFVMISLGQFGVLNGVASGARGVLFWGASLLGGLAVSAGTFLIARKVAPGAAGRLMARLAAGVWIVAALIPAVFALIRGRLG